MTAVAEPDTAPEQTTNGHVTLDDLTPEQLNQLMDQLRDRQPDDGNGELPTALEAILRVMDDVQYIAKGEEYKESNSERVKYRFRGVDTVMQAVGPALRRHRIVPVPWVDDVKQTESINKNNTRMRETVTTVIYRLYGPKGDHVEARIAGEAADAGDKSVTKSESVAYRTLWLQLLCIPTGEPDPDLLNYERAGDAAGTGAATREAGESSRDQLLETVATTSTELRELLEVGEYEWLEWLVGVCRADFQVDITAKQSDDGPVEEIDWSKLRNNQLHVAVSKLRRKLKDEQRKRARAEVMST